MNSNVIEIVTILVQKLLHNEDLSANEEEIIQGLLDLGYNLRDIEVAFELIFSSAEIIGVSENFENHKYLPTSERILSPRERFVFSDEARGVLFYLHKVGLLTDGELEELIKRGTTSLSQEIGLKELWFFLKTEIRDPIRLTVIKKQIPGLQQIKDDQDYWIH